MEERRASKLVGRRYTLHLLGVGLAAGGFLAACKQDKESNSGGEPTAPTPPSGQPSPQPAAGGGSAALDCNTPVDAASKQTRLVMQYKNPAAIPEKHCSACAQYIPGKYGDCGGCKLFTGPVNPNGGCLSFAPLAGAAPAKSG